VPLQPRDPAHHHRHIRRLGAPSPEAVSRDRRRVWFVEQCLSNALRLETYIKDAERENDDELADLFRRAQEASRRGAEQGKELLGKRISA
jgi:hypothetical protein